MTQESPRRIIQLKQAVEHCLKSGMPKSKLLEICKSEIYGAAKLRESIREALAPDKFLRVSFYEQILDKQLTTDQILSTVEHVLKERRN